MTQTQEQLLRSIEQQLENLMVLDVDLVYQYECDLYYDCGEGEEPKPIIELFTPELLTKLENLVRELETDEVDYDVEEQNYCDQKSVTMEFTFEEHDLFNDVLCHALDTIYFSLGDQFNRDSEVCERYRMIEDMRNRSLSIWSKRFNND